MTRLIKFTQQGYTVPDFLNPAHLKTIIFSDELCSLEMTGDTEFTVSVAEGWRIVSEINGFPDADAPAASAVEKRLQEQIQRDIEFAHYVDQADRAAATKPHFAPDQPIVNLDSFKAMLKAGHYVVLDTETTGLEDGEIMQIAIVHSSGDVLLDTLVKPNKPIPADATRIHGITNEMVANAPTWEKVRELVYTELLGEHVVIYNAVYDRKMMHKSSERWGLPKTEWKEIAAFWCAMEMFAAIYGDWNEYRGNYRWQRLSTAAAHYGIEQTEAHTALADCLTTLAVCKAMAGA